MGLSVQVGQFTASTGGSATTVNCNFKGKAILLWTHGHTGDTETAGAIWSFGLSDGSNHHSAGWGADDAASTSNVAMANSGTNALQILGNIATPAFATGGQLSSVAFNASTFVCTFNATPSSAWLINFILIGGTDANNVFVGSKAMPTSAGTLSVTDVGFRGNIVFLLASQQTGGGAASQTDWSFGCAVSSTNRWSFGHAIRDAQTTGPNVNGMTIMRTDSALVGMTNLDAVNILADFTGFTASGFDLNFSTAPASAFLLHYLVIQGGRWDCGTSAKPTTAAAQTVSGEAFQPTLLGLFTSSPTASNSSVSNAISSFGASDGTNSRAAGAFHNDAINTVAKTLGDVTHCLIDYDRANNPLASFTSFNSDGFTITWSATGTAHQVGWFTAADQVPRQDEDFWQGPPVPPTDPNITVWQ